MSKMEFSFFDIIFIYCAQHRYRNLSMLSTINEYNVKKRKLYFTHMFVTLTYVTPISLNKNTISLQNKFKQIF